MGSVNKTTNLGLPQWLGNEYFERTDMNDAFKSIDDAQGTITAAIDEAASNLASAKTELEGEIEAAKTDAADNLANAKTELNSTITAAKSEAASNLASAKTELQNNIDTLNTKVNELWCAMLEAGYAYSCTMEEDYSASVASVMGTGTNSGNVADLYCCETLGTAVQLGKKETYVFSADSDSSGVGYDTVIEVYTIGGTKRRYKQVADASGNWSGAWS